jgi:hypothetical protein
MADYDDALLKASSLDTQISVPISGSLLRGIDEGQ